MAQLYATGPVYVFCAVDTGGGLLYLGTGERAPRISITPAYRDVQCDLGGEAPFDTMYSGNSGRVTVTLMRYNEAVLRKIEDYAASLHLIRGQEDPGEIGSLMLTEGLAYQLVLVFPYATKTAFADMPAGYNFLAAYVRGPDDIESGTSNPKKVQITWQCLRKFDITNQNNFGAGSFKLYDHNIPNGLNALLN